MNFLTDLKSYGRFALGLPFFLRQRLTLAEAGEILRRRLGDRENSFIRLVELGIYEYPNSPYLPLLKMAGCQSGDIIKMVRQRGLEETLEVLRQAGVYISFEEFKGRKPVVRNGQIIPVDPRQFDNPFLKRYFRARSGGTTGEATRVSCDMDYLKATTAVRMLVYQVHSVLDVPTAIWYGILPDSTGINNILRSVLYGNIPSRWFTPITGHDFKQALKHRLAATYIHKTARLAGVFLPEPEPLHLDQSAVLAHWAVRTAEEHGRSLVRSHVSMVLRICLSAEKENLDLSGVTFMGGGEPPTPVKVERITGTGATWVPTYVSSETGPMGWGCARPIDGNDLHFLKDSLALIQNPMSDSDTGIRGAFYFTTLLPTALKIMLNVETDDHGIIEKRSCGCPLETLGFTEHLRDIGSPHKLTGEGVNLADSDMVRILEEVLPYRFGGTGEDYQLMEEEDEEGFTRLILLIHPRIELPDEKKVLDCVMENLRKRGRAADMAGALWKQAGTMRIRRDEPIWTPRGKLMPLHLKRRSR